ncbi:hypothetical protein [Alteromonas gracilis]|uniref:hypothetical protein n=1 Tax=Alteromonas gracilis TaxID=1479524 RepID=UPI003735CA0B
MKKMKGEAMRITTRKGLPTKASLYRLAEKHKVSINSLDNRTDLDCIAWQHHKEEAIKAFMKDLEEAGFSVTDYAPYIPKEHCGSFRIGPRYKFPRA